MIETAFTTHAVPAQGSHSDRDRDRHRAPRRVISLHGEDPSGIPATWHVTPLDDDADGAFLIERADGDIHSPHLWMQAQRDAIVVSETEVIELFRSVMFGR